MLQRHRAVVGVDIVGVVKVGIGSIFDHEFSPGLDVGIVLPCGIIRVLDVGRRKNAHARLKPGRLHHRVDPDGDVGQKCQRPPANLVDLANRLRRELRRRRDHQDVGAR